jgi:peptidoglycan-associated lipoprotein
MPKTLLCLLAALLVGSGGCAHRKLARGPATEFDDLDVSKSGASDHDELGECGVRVHFQYDSAELAELDREHLGHAAECLKADHALRVTIEGNADERGTEEYNLALGDKRAVAVAKYLSSLGASRDQLKTISYGEENPLCNEHAETCWVKNRRAAVRPNRLKTATKD